MQTFLFSLLTVYQCVKHCYMKNLSNADYASVLRLLESLSRRQGTTVREKEDARKAFLLMKKMRRKDGKARSHQDIPIHRGLEVV